MKHPLVGILLALSLGTAQAQWNYDNSPFRVFDMKKNLTNKVTVEISYVPANRVTEACNAQSRQFGLNGFDTSVMSCTFEFFPDRCVMILPTNPDMRMVGHEFMHCLQGEWHR